MDDPPQKQREVLTGWKLVGIIFNTIGGLLIGILSSPYATIIPTPNTLVPSDSLDLAVCIVLLSMLALFNGVVARRKLRQSGVEQIQRRVSLRRPAFKMGSRFLRYQLVLLFALFIYFGNESWTAATVGFTQEFPGADFAVGLFAYAFLLIILAVIFRLQGTAEAQADNTVTTMAALWPREPRQKLAMTVAVCLINPIAEELIFRGILVYQLGLALGSFQLPIVLGLLVSLANHAYQGRRAILLHTLYYLFAVTLLFSPMGLMGAIGMHFRRRHRARRPNEEKPQKLPRTPSTRGEEDRRRVADPGDRVVRASRQRERPESLAMARRREGDRTEIARKNELGFELMSC
jgi:membrane protease YdiL (CAAX protease family)